MPMGIITIMNATQIIKIAITLGWLVALVNRQVARASPTRSLSRKPQIDVK